MLKLLSNMAGILYFLGFDFFKFMEKGREKKITYKQNKGRTTKP